MGRENHETRARITTDNPNVNFNLKKLIKPEDVILVVQS